LECEDEDALACHLCEDQKIFHVYEDGKTFKLCKDQKGFHVWEDEYTHDSSSMHMIYATALLSSSLRFVCVFMIEYPSRVCMGWKLWHVVSLNR